LDIDVAARFWGVRGTIPCPGPRTMRYGGNTSCVELRCGTHVFILDGGSGLRALGAELVAAAESVDADLFFTHTHIDHIMGLTAFAPARIAATRLRLWAGHLLPENNLEQALFRLVSPPVFPVPLSAFEARLEYRDFRCGETLAPADGVVVRTAPLNHPDGATGYRFECGGKAVAYVTDTEHRPGVPDQNVLQLISAADLMIYDSTYEDEDFRIGRGHSSWQEALRLADAAQVRQVALFHHNPEHDDEAMDRIGARAAAWRSGALVAREGMVVRL
jgi:phosphoribosyl 1,2-cyclic phosphodiesterase